MMPKNLISIPFAFPRHFFPRFLMLLLLGSFVLLALWSCSREKPDPEARIVARVGDKTITVREFRRNYEAGFAHLKTGPDRKRTYLDYMIKEELLALEGYRRGFDQSESVQNAQAKLLNELMVEALIEREVKSKITVSMDEIKDAINKSKVSFKFRYWPESSREKAQQIAAAMRERGYAEVVDEQLRNNPERQINPQDFETDYKNWMEVSPDVLEAIKDLPYGDISDPVEIDGQYLVFQVLDIRRQGVTTNEYIGKASTFEQMVYYRKLQEAVTRYVSDLMSPKNVVTRGESMKLLANAVLEWHQRGEGQFRDFATAVQQAGTDFPHLKALRDQETAPFTTFKGGQISIAAFLKEFDPSRMRVGYNGKTEFLDILNNTVAITLRDHFLRREAERQQLQQTPAVQQELALWRDKWVYNATRTHFSLPAQVDSAEAAAYFAAHQARYRIRKDQKPDFQSLSGRVKQDVYLEQNNRYLTGKTDSLAAIFPVTVYEEILDTVRVIDFKKSRWAGVQVFKSGVNRPAYPAVDPAWGAGLSGAAAPPGQ